MLHKEEISKYVKYDSNSPTFLVWNVKRGKVKEGDKAGTFTKNRKTSYAVVRISNKPYYAHRLIWILFNGNIPENAEVDHIDGTD